jgi:hypothetical protein
MAIGELFDMDHYEVKKIRETLYIRNPTTLLWDKKEFPLMQSLLSNIGKQMPALRSIVHKSWSYYVEQSFMYRHLVGLWYEMAIHLEKPGTIVEYWIGNSPAVNLATAAWTSGSEAQRFRLLSSLPVPFDASGKSAK